MQIPYHRTPGGFLKSAGNQYNDLQAHARALPTPRFRGTLCILRLNIYTFFMGVCGQGGCSVLGTEPTDTGKLGMNSTTEPTLALGHSSHITKKKMGRAKPEGVMCLHTPPSIYTLGTYTPFRKPVSEMCLCYKAK